MRKPKFEAATAFKHEGKEFAAGDDVSSLPTDTIEAGLRMGYVKRCGAEDGQPSQSGTASPPAEPAKAAPQPEAVDKPPPTTKE